MASFQARSCLEFLQDVAISIFVAAPVAVAKTASNAGATIKRMGYSILRKSFEVQKETVMKETQAILEETIHELQTTQQDQALIQAAQQTIKAEMHNVEVKLEKIFAEIEAAIEADPQAMCTGGTMTKDFEEANKKMELMQQKQMKQLKAESVATQKQYKLANDLYKTQLQSAKDEIDADFRNSIAVRQTAQYQGTEQGRNSEVVRLLQKYHENYLKQAEQAVRKYEDAAAELEKTAREAKEKADAAQEAKKKVEALLREEGKRRKEAEAAKTGSSSASHKKVEAAAAKMVASGAINTDKLRGEAIGGAYVWVWMEDSARFEAADGHADAEKKFGSSSDPVVLYSQPVWANLEAHYLLVSAGAPAASYGTVQIDVGQKVFAQGSGQHYSVDLGRLTQKNINTNYERPIRRIAIANLYPDALSQLKAQRLAALQEAERATAASTLAARKAELDAKRAIHLKEQADERVKGADISLWQVEYPNGKPVGLEQIAMGWSNMGTNRYTEVKLSSAEPEYQQVAALFTTSSGKPVRSVLRVQNLLLWHLYEKTRSLVAKTPLNKGEPNEHYLWHGCGKGGHGALEKILVGGFDEKFSTCTPQGIWLSTNSKYSASGYCPTYGNVKKILLVRTTLGYVGRIIGKSQLETVNGTEVDSHHCGGTSRGHVRQTGGGDNRYVVNRNNQVYPAYVVEFA